MAEIARGMHKCCTLQLHTCVVHLAEMALAYGPSAFRTEFWVERMIQLLKRVTKYRTASSPEQVAVNAWQLRAALLAWTARGGDDNVTEVYDAVDPNQHKGAARRDMHDADGVCLLGRLQDHNEDGATVVGPPLSSAVLKICCPRCCNQTGYQHQARRKADS